MISSQRQEGHPGPGEAVLHCPENWYWDWPHSGQIILTSFQILKLYEHDTECVKICEHHLVHFEGESSRESFDR